MNAAVNPYLDRISIKADVRSGRPCIRDTRIAVQEVLRWLASGATEEEILNDYPYLNSDDFRAVFAYAAELTEWPQMVSGLPVGACSASMNTDKHG